MKKTIALLGALLSFCAISAQETGTVSLFANANYNFEETVPYDLADLKIKEAEWVKFQYVGKEGERKEDTLKIPLTFEGFKRYCWDINIGCVEQYFVNQDKLLYHIFSNLLPRMDSNHHKLVQSQLSYH